MNIPELQNRVGALAVQIAAFEQDCGQPTQCGTLMLAYDRLLKDQAEAKSQLRAAIAEKHHEYNLDLLASYGV